MWFVYLIECVDKSIYTGVTNNVEKRFSDHVGGKGGRYTRSHKPQTLLYTETFDIKGDALKRECQIKEWPREKKLDLIKKALDL